MEYAVIILVGMFLVVSVSLLGLTLQDRALESNIRASLTQLAIQTSDSIGRMYDTSKDSKASPGTNGSVLLTVADLKLPAAVSGRNYRVQLVSPSGIWSQVTSVNVDGTNITATNGSLIESTSAGRVIAKTLQSPLVTIEYVIPNVPILLQGFTDSGAGDELKYYRINFNGTTTDRIVLGNSSSLIDLRIVN